MSAKTLLPFPRRLAAAVAFLTAAMLLVELIATRLFSVLFFYHYSFFAISLVMSGLAFGGLLASRWDLRACREGEFYQRLAWLAAFFSVASLGATLFVISYPPIGKDESPSVLTVALFALVFVPGLTAAGAFLAAAFSREPAWIGRLYAADLAAAGAACAGAILLLRLVQGPAGLLATGLLAALSGLTVAPRKGAARTACLILAVLSAVGMVSNASRGGRFLRLPVDKEPIVERWNEHSRVIVPAGMKTKRYLILVIDKTAATSMLKTRKRTPGDPPPVEKWWGEGSNYYAYQLGRPMRRTAVIGAGGGRDVMAALTLGAQHVDGYELNGILIDLARNQFADFCGMAAWPEVTLIHNEARVGIAHSGQKYDLIQASLIDTWAATAGGGLVLSENGLYTVEGWRTFLSALSDTGVLTMTRFYIPEAPAEIQRLVSLAVTALEKDGIADARPHLVLVGGASEEESRKQHHVWATIIVSRTPFTSGEVELLRKLCADEDRQLLVAPGVEPADPVIARILDPAQRAAAIASSPYDISAPTDLRPFFFLQVRPWDVLGLAGSRSGFLLDLTFKAVRVMMLLGGLSVLFAVAVLLVGAVTLPSASATPEQKRLYRWMSLYFLGIGFGYILVQLGLHQRLTLILGHPTLALSVVLASMLVGTGIGSFASRPLFSDTRLAAAWMSIVAVLALLVLGVSGLSYLNQIDSSGGRIAAAGLLTGVVGFVLGFGFPLGVRLVAPAGEWAVQKMWAINGAASIAGSSIAAIIGVGMGCRAVLATGLAFYALVAVCGVAASKAARSVPPERAEVSVRATRRARRESLLRDEEALG